VVQNYGLRPAVGGIRKKNLQQSQDKKDLNAAHTPRQTVLTWFRKAFNDKKLHQRKEQPCMAKPSDKDPGKKPFIALTRKAVAAWVVVVFIISAWMFGMGMMVGRGTAPVQFDLDQLKRNLESMKSSQTSKKDVARIESSEMKEKTKLDFYEALPKNREDTDMSAIAKPPPPVAAKEPVPQKPPEPQTTQKVEKPAAAPGGAPAPTAAPAAPGKGYTVQVSALRTEEEARALLEKLRQKGYAGYIEPIAIPDKGTWYRVRMGEFPSKEFAGSTLDRLKKDGFAPAVVPK
jgi:cell division septation protein DedD